MGAFLRSGLTYRQVDRWTTRGYLRADVASPGSGINRTYPDSELSVARTMLELTRAGVSLPAAARLARENPLRSGELVALLKLPEGEPSS